MSLSWPEDCLVPTFGQNEALVIVSAKKGGAAWGGI